MRVRRPTGPPGQRYPQTTRRWWRALLAASMALGGVMAGAGGVVVSQALSASPAFASAGAIVPSSAFTGFSDVQMAPTDDSSWPCGPNNASGPIACPVSYNGVSYNGPAPFNFGFNLNVFGTQYGGAYVNTNGNITFGSYLSTYTPFGLASTHSVIIAPFFADVDTRAGATVNIGTGYLDGYKTFVVNWPGVGCYHEDDNVTNDFQLLLIDRPDLGTSSLGDDFQIEFNYDSVQWDAGQASNANANCTDAPNGDSATVGYSNGTTTPGDTYQMTGSQTSGAFLDSSPATGLIYNDLGSDLASSIPHSANGVPGRYIFNVDNGQPQAPASLAGSLSSGHIVATNVSVLAGVAVTASASLSGANAAAAGGSVTYSVFSDSGCTDQVASGGTVDVSGGNVPSSSPVTLTGPGTYYWEATYSGDAQDGAASSGCTNRETVTVPPGTTTTGTVYYAANNTPWAGNTAVTGSSAYDQAAVTRGYTGGPQATGTVTYDLFPDTFCTGAPRASHAVSLSGGTAPSSAVTPALAAGPYSYEAAYSGDSVYTPSNSACQAFTVGKASPSVATVVDDSGTGRPWAANVTAGAQAYEAATLSGMSGFVPTGNVTYDLYANGACAGTAMANGTVTASAGTVPRSFTTSALGPASYSFQATYSGDANYSSVVSACSAFSTTKATPGLSTTVDDASSQQTWAGTEATGATAYGAAMVSAVAGLPATGTVVYNFYNNGSCHGSPTTSDTVTLSGGTVPRSTTTWALVPGPYSYQVSYSGDSSYVPVADSCQAFTVVKTVLSLTTAVYDATSRSSWGPGVGVGATAYDTSTLSGAQGPNPTGMLSYDFFPNGLCTGTPTAMGTFTLQAGAAPASSTTSALATGPYSFQASYSGDANYNPAASACEAFSASQVAPTVSVVVEDSSSGHPWDGAEVTGDSAAGQAVVQAVGGLVPNGTLNYHFYDGASCNGNSISTGTVNLAGGSAPTSARTPALGAGDYSLQAGYAGDAKYLASTSNCQGFTVGKTAAILSAQVLDSSTRTAWSGNETDGAVAYGTATLKGLSGFTPMGTVTYIFYTDSSCTGPGGTGGTVNLVGGTVPASSHTSALPVGTYSFRGTYSGGPNYLSSTSACERFTVKTADLKVIAPSPDISYGAALPTLVPGYVGFAPGDTEKSLTPPANCTTTATKASVPGTYPVTCSGASDPNYTITYTGGQLTLLPAALFVVGPTLSMAKGSAVPALAPTYVGFVNGDSPSALNGAVTCSTTATAYSPPGKYRVTCSGASDPYYLVNYIPGSLTVKGTTSTRTTPSGPGPTAKHPKGKTSAPRPVAGVTTHAGRLLAITPKGDGWWVLGSKGSVRALGKAKNYGDLHRDKKAWPIVAIEATPDGKGYWLAGANGSVYCFGDARPHGSEAGRHLAGRIVAIVATADGRGYWLAGSDGGVFSFGDAHFRGSRAGRHITGKIVGIAATGDGKGYWLVTSAGAVYPFGDAHRYGQTKGKHLVGAIVGLAPTPKTGGYWMLGADGGLFNFGSARFYGSDGGKRHKVPVIGLISGSTGKYYFLVDGAGKRSRFPKH